MSSNKWEWNIDGFNALRNDEGVMKFCSDLADQIIGACDSSYSYGKSEWNGPHRCNVSINVLDYRTLHHNYKTNEVLKAMGAVKG